VRGRIRRCEQSEHVVPEPLEAVEHTETQETRAPERQTLGGKPWPTGITCEMNIPEWEKALQLNDLLPEYQDVINGLKNVFDQGILPHRVGELPYYTPQTTNPCSKQRKK
jgi:hypothetical protein